MVELGMCSLAHCGPLPCLRSSQWSGYPAHRQDSSSTRKIQGSRSLTSVLTSRSTVRARCPLPQSLQGCRRVALQPNKAKHHSLRLLLAGVRGQHNSVSRPPAADRAAKGGGQQRMQLQDFLPCLSQASHCNQDPRAPSQCGKSVSVWYPTCHSTR